MSRSLKRLSAMAMALCLTFGVGYSGRQPVSALDTIETVSKFEESYLREKYPEYFDLTGSKGLEVYVTQTTPDNFCCVLTEGTNRNKTDEELSDLFLNSTSIDEMKAILSCYNIPKEDIFIIPWQNPVWEYGYPIDADYCKKLREMFFEEEVSVKGDVNADGEFNVADLVALQKWLLAVPDVELKNWRAADLCKDDRLDVFDMVMMRRELINSGIVRRNMTKDEFVELLLSKDEFTWSDFESYKSEDIGSGKFILKYEIADENGENFYLYVTGSDMNKKPESIYLMMDGRDEKKDIYEFRDELGSFGDLYDEITWEIAPIADGVGFSDTLDKEYIITSTKELGDYFYSIYSGIIDCDVDCPENETVTEFLHKYDDKFFENNILLMKPFYQFLSNGSFPYAIDTVMYSDDTLCVYYTVNTYGDCIEVFNPYLALVTVPKSMYHAEKVEWVQQSSDVVESTLLTIEREYYAPGENGYETVNETKNLYESSIENVDDLKAIKEFTANISDYKDCKMTDMGLGIDDYGFDTLKAYYTDENGNKQELILCEFGGMCKWLDNTKVQNFVDMLIEKEYFADKYIYEWYKNNYRTNKKMPYIIDETGSVTLSERETIWETLAYRYPDTDLSDFELVYTPEHPLEKYLNHNVFSVYYKGILCHGYGNLNTDSNVYVINISSNFVCPIEKYSEVDVKAECIPVDKLSEYVDFDFNESDVTKILYISDSKKKPVLAYRIVSLDCEYIIDAITGEQIDWIPYYVV